MFNIRSIIWENRKTFRNYRTGERLPVFRRNIILIFLAAALALVFGGPAEAFLRSVLTVEGIVVGFSFSILFFLVNNSKVEFSENLAIEDEISLSRLSALSIELFHNVTYFVLISLLLIGCSLFLLLPFSEVLERFFEYIIVRIEGVDSRDFARRIFDSIDAIVEVVVSFSFWFLFLEVALTLFRILGRVSFLFSERLRLLNSSGDNE